MVNDPLRIPEAEKRLRHQQRMERLPRVIKLYLQGVSAREIAKAESISLSAVYKDMGYARRMWARNAEKMADQFLNEELQRINLIESEAWNQWERSKLNAKEKTRDTAADGKTSYSRKSRGQCGDPRYLEIALKCVDKRCRILKIGEYSSEETLAAAVRAVEIVVENAEQANRILQYEEFDAMLQPSDN